MDVKLKTLGDLFNQPARYVVPEYQRKYVWNEEDQWEPLWDDILNVAEPIVKPRRQRKETGPGRSHFMGSIVLMPQSDSSTRTQKVAVVDGQQRLLTLQLILDAARQECEERHSEVAKKLSALVWQRPEDRDARGGDGDFRMWPADPEDQNAFREAMRSEQRTEKRKKEQIIQAHSWFARRIAAWLDESPKAAESRAEALYQALTAHLQITAIELGADDDEQMIFETLNSRGTPLKMFDLAKNFLLHQASSQGLNQKQFQSEYLREFGDKWWGRETGSSRPRRSHVEAFLHHWLAMETAREIPLAQTFRLFRKHVEKKHKGEVERVADDLRRFGEAYRELQNADDSRRFSDDMSFRFGDFVRRWRVLQTDVFTPLILWLWGEGGSDQQVIRAYDALDSYMIRRLVCGLDTRGYGAISQDLLVRVKARGRKGADKIIIEHLASKRPRRQLWPFDSEVIGSLTNERLQDRASAARIRKILEAIELSFPGSQWKIQGGAKLASGRLSIEHIMPQSPDDADWPPPDPKLASPRETAEQARYRLTGSIGNLTLVPAGYNQKLARKSWTDKIVLYAERPSDFALNQDLLRPGGRAALRDWNEEEIRKRSERLAKSVVKIWPRPS